MESISDVTCASSFYLFLKFFVRFEISFCSFHRSASALNNQIKGVFTWHRGDFRPGASSLRFPLMALYLFTWYHHKMLCRRESPRREFTPVLAPGREFHSGTKSRNGIM